MEQIPAILLTNKQYGKVHKNKNDNKFYYKCISKSTEGLSSFLVPFSQKIEFNKKKNNYYVIISPIDSKFATLIETIGEVSDYDSFCKYNLYCKLLINNIGTFNKFVYKQLKQLKEIPFEEIIQEIDNKILIENREHLKIYTIDPETSKDFDDAFGITKIENSNNFKLSIYISNVVLIADILKIWPYIGKCPATIYLNSSSYQPMIPKSLSENLCSLKENETRFAFTMDIEIDEFGNILNEPTFINSKIKVTKNMSYENCDDLFDYKILENLVKKMNEKNNLLENIFDSHDVIAYIMILMNSISANLLNEKEIEENLQNDLGVFRTTGSIDTNKENYDNVPLELRNFLQIWSTNGPSGANYTLDKNMEHKILKKLSYVHITSPIRRIVDILNIIALQKKLKIYESDDSMHFYKEQIKNLDEINKKFKSIRKFQNECELLKLSINNLEKIYKGYIIEKVEKIEKVNYVVYLPEIKMITNLNISTELEINKEYNFKIYTFEDENSYKKKVRIMITN